VGRRRTVQVNDSVLAPLLTRYLTARGYRHGPLFRAEKNYVGGPLYASVEKLWAKYRGKHRSAMIISFVTLTRPTWSAPETIRCRLGHANA
jgi:hypothetical protein